MKTKGVYEKKGGRETALRGRRELMENGVRSCNATLRKPGVLISDLEIGARAQLFLI